MKPGHNWLQVNSRALYSFILFGILFGYSLVSMAAPLEIFVRAKGTADPVVEASIVDLQSQEFVSTDAQGKASFDDINTPTTLRVLAPGFDVLEKRLKKFPKNGKALILFIEPTVSEGEGLVVYGERVKEKTSKHVLVVEELKRMPGTQGDPLKAIQNLPGVVTAAEGTGVMYVRGSDPFDNIFRVDGMAGGYVYHFGGLHSTINAQAISDFNIFLGGFPVDYGDALGGVIDTKLRTPRSDRIRHKYSIGTYESSFALEGPLGAKDGKSSFFLGARRSYIDFILGPKQVNDILGNDVEEGEELPVEIVQVPQFYDITAKWNYKLNKGNFSILALSMGDELKILNNQSKETDPVLAGALGIGQAYHGIGANWQQRWTKDLRSELILNAYHMEQEVRFGVNPETNQSFFITIKDQEAYVVPKLMWSLNDKHQLTLGSENIYARVPVNASSPRPQTALGPINSTATGLDVLEDDIVIMAGYISPFVKMRSQISKQLNLSYGMRYSYMRGSGGVEMGGWSPRANLEYQINDKTFFTAATGRFLQPPPGQEWAEKFGNPSLMPKKSNHQIIGLERELNDLWNVKAEIYRKPVWNLVVPHPSKIYANQGSGHAQGFDILLRRKFNDRKMGWFSYAYLKSTRSNDLINESFPFDGDQTHSLNFLWSQPMWHKGALNKWVAGARFRLASGKPYSKVTGRDLQLFCPSPDPNNEGSCLVPLQNYYVPRYDEGRNNSRLPLFYQLDVRLDREFYFNHFKYNFYLEVFNVTASKNVSGYDYGKAYENTDNPKKISSGLPLPTVGIELEF